jgi:hypothetical protein
MVKRLFLFAFSFLFISGILLAQRRIDYNYDQNGNRDKRVLTVVPLKSAVVSCPDSLMVEEETTEETVKKFISIFPNPVHTLLTIKIIGYEEELRMTAGVFNMEGNKLKQDNILSSESTMELGTLQDGVYILRITIGNEIFQYKIIKSN